MTTHRFTALLLLPLLLLTACTVGEDSRMAHVLAEADRQNQAYDSITGVDSLVLATQYYDRHGTPNERMRAHYLLGCAYRDMGEAPKALDYLHKAVDDADTASQTGNFKLLCRIHGQLGELLYTQVLFESALEEYEKGYQYALKAQEPLSAARFYEQKAKCYFSLGKQDSLLAICEKTAEMYRQYGDEKAANTCLGSVAAVYLQRNDYTRAAKYINLYENRSYLSEEGVATYEPWKILYVYKGLYCQGVGKLDSAAYYFRKVIGKCRYLPITVEAYKGMVAVYEKMGRPDSLSKYALGYCAVNDSSILTLNSTTIERMQALHNYSRYQQAAEKSRFAASRAQFATRLALLVILLLLLASVSTVLIIHYINKGRMQLMTSQYAANMLLYSEAVSHLKSLKRQDAGLKQKIVQKEEEIAATRRSLAEYLPDKQIPEDWMPDDAIFDTAVVKKMHKLAIVGKIASDEDWCELRQKVNEYMEDFVSRLMQADLDLKDTQICLLTKLRFSPGEQCVLLHLKSNTLSNRRARLLGKLFNEQGGSARFESKIRQW